MYDKNNVFAKILRGEIPSNKIYEDNFVLAFHTIAPEAKVHALVIPKGEFTDIYEFISNADSDFQSGFWAGVRATVDKLNLMEFRTIANTGAVAGQSVFHFHIHIMAN
jgi:diadenosine tetraphosphate (Ap4A) HIT family hydrolase